MPRSRTEGDVCAAFVPKRLFRPPGRLEHRNESRTRVVDQLQYVEVFDLGRDAINPRHHVDDLLREEATGFLLVIPHVEVLCLAGTIEREALEAQAGHAVERSSGFVGNLRESWAIELVALRESHEHADHRASYRLGEQQSLSQESALGCRRCHRPIGPSCPGWPAP